MSQDNEDLKKEIDLLEVSIFDWSGGRFKLYIFSDARVTAWMPKPKPCEGEKDE